MWRHTRRNQISSFGETRIHLNRRLRQFIRLLASEVCASAVVMLDTPSFEVAWRVPATHFIRQLPLHFLSRASPCVISAGLYQLITQLTYVLKARLVIMPSVGLYVDIYPVILMPASSDRSPYLSCLIRVWIGAVLCHVQSARFPKTVIRAARTSNPVCLIWWFYHSSTSIDCGIVIGSSVDCSGPVTLHLRSRDTSCSVSPKVSLLLVMEHSKNMVFRLAM